MPHVPSFYPAKDILCHLFDLTTALESGLTTWLTLEILVRVQMSNGTAAQTTTPYNFSSQTYVLDDLAHTAGLAKNALLRTHEHSWWLEHLPGYVDLLMAVHLLQETAIELPDFWATVTFLDAERLALVNSISQRVASLHKRKQMNEDEEEVGWYQVGALVESYRRARSHVQPVGNPPPITPPPSR